MAPSRHVLRFSAEIRRSEPSPRCRQLAVGPPALLTVRAGWAIRAVRDPADKYWLACPCFPKGPGLDARNMPVRHKQHHRLKVLLLPTTPGVCRICPPHVVQVHADRSSWDKRGGTRAVSGVGAPAAGATVSRPIPRLNAGSRNMG